MSNVGSRSSTSVTDDPAEGSPTPSGLRATAARELVVDVADVGMGRAKLVPFERDGEPLTAMIVADGAGGVMVYVNRCPHVPYSLDLGDGNVLDDDRKTIVCSNHGARFEPATGRCIWGPVRGRYLERLPFRKEGTRLVITLTPEASGWPETYEPTTP